MSNAFRPTGNSVVLGATSAGVSAQVTNVTQASEYMMTNVSTSDIIWVAIGFGSAPTVTIPASGSPGNAFPVLHQQPPLVIAATADAYFAAKVSGGGTHNLVITPGEAVK